MTRMDTLGNVYDHATSSDLPELHSLFQRDLTRTPNQALLRQLVGEELVVIARSGEGELIGFAYAVPSTAGTDPGWMPGDVIELRNILVSRGWRSSGVGSELLVLLEERVRKEFPAIVLFNSFLYVNADEKRDPTEFYARHGYTKIGLTKDTQLFYKSFV